MEKDRSLEGFVEAGYAEFTPLLDFRDWLVSIRNDPERRTARRRDGRVTITASGVYIPGPFTLETRAEILERLLAMQSEVQQPLIARAEIDRIRELWAEDAISASRRLADEHEAANRCPMAKKVVVLLDTEDGRGLVRRKCRSAKLKIATFELLVDAELDQQGKQRKAGLWDEFDRIFDEEHEEGAPG